MIKEIHVFKMVLVGPLHIPMALRGTAWQVRMIQNGNTGQIGVIFVTASLVPQYHQ